MPPGAHAVLGASSSERWMTCPGSVRLSHGRPDDTSIYAIIGTAAHELVERCLREGIDAADAVGETVAVPERSDDGTIEIHQIEVDEEMADAVQVMVDHVRSRWETGDVYLELQMSLEALDPPEDMFGTGDVVIWHGDNSLLEIIDYKHGQGVAVDAVENSQLKYYALAAVVTLKVKPETIQMTIVQPRGHHPAGTIRSDEISWADLVAFKRELFAAAEATQAPDAPLVPGEHCRFCRALAVCPAQKQQALEVAKSAFPDDLEQKMELPEPDELTLPELAKVLAAKGQIQDWLAAVESHCFSQMDKGEEVPGFKLVEGRKGNRKWTDEEAADTYLKGQKVKVADRYTKKLVSPAQAEKILKKNKKELPDRLVSRSDGKPKIAPVGDARPALVPTSAADVFGTLPGTATDPRDATA